MARTLDDVKTDYAKAAGKLGDVVYHASRFEKIRLDTIAEMEKLQEEAAGLQKEPDGGAKGS